MIFRLFRRSDNQAVIEGLYAGIVAAARQPMLYTDYGMSDTFEGRFDSLTLHTALVLRRLNTLPAPGSEIAQDLIDTVFRHFDRTLREMGVGDTTVPKRMKKLAEAFLGRSAAYDEALRQGHDALAATLARNILSTQTGAADNASKDLSALTRYVEAVADELAKAPLQVFVDGQPPFPDLSRFTSEASI
jgi:cytochrome b pre-mRNA-processing protein 3